MLRIILTQLLLFSLPFIGFAIWLFLNKKAQTSENWRDGPMLWLVIAGGLLVIGGLIYTSGVFVFISPRVKFRRAIWHGFVVTGAMTHWAAVLVGVVLAPAALG